MRRCSSSSFIALCIYFKWVDKVCIARKQLVYQLILFRVFHSQKIVKTLRIIAWFVASIMYRILDI